MKRTKLQVLLNGSWQFVQCGMPNRENPVTTITKELARNGEDIQSFRDAFPGHAFRSLPV